MKLRYYMRGLGIGVIVTAILMGIALGGDKEKLTDAEIIARAGELGMVESSVLADLNKNKEQESKTEESQSTESQSSETEESQTSESQGSETQEPQTDESQGSETQEPQTDESQSGETGESQTDETVEEYVTLVIERGASSVSVSKALEKLGLVESAKDFDRYLCNNGYDKSIKVGTHKIKVGSTEEEIAKTISRKK